jgi:hypothetical protein
MKHSGVETLTPARALIAEIIRRYWILGIECALLEVQKLAYFLERQIEAQGMLNKLDLRFETNRFGPYAPRLKHLLNALDGSYLHCNKRLADAGPLDVIWFEDAKREIVAAYLSSDAKEYLPALDVATQIIDGFESPLGMELLATVDWLVYHERVDMTRDAIKAALRKWPGGAGAAERKVRLFEDRLIDLALQRIASFKDSQRLIASG